MKYNDKFFESVFNDAQWVHKLGPDCCKVLNVVNKVMQPYCDFVKIDEDEGGKSCVILYTANDTVREKYSGEKRRRYTTDFHSLIPIIKDNLRRTDEDYENSEVHIVAPNSGEHFGEVQVVVYLPEWDEK